MIRERFERREVSKSRNLEDVKTGRLENAKLKDSGRLARLE
ncbi:hypothetical protein BURPS406E_C1714 [Burkholderia pseudomallei 406e]|nr:hypothetical protein BURPS406E_C1714 [Burkholderia pseudomallei 406e]EDS82753.1 hypothetical protein BURPSS13_K0291 [Burkholderia pseudomallei S13]